MTQWGAQGRQIIALRRLAVMSRFVHPDEVEPDATGRSFLRYHGSDVVVAQRTAADASPSHSLHVPTGTISLPADSTDGDPVPLKMNFNQAYALFCALDQIQNRLDAIGGAAAGGLSV